MAKQGKRYRECLKAFEIEKRYSVGDASEVLSKFKGTKFDETVELTFRLGVDPKHADQMVRGSILLPHGTGQSVRVLVIAKGEKEREAKEAGAEFVGSDEIVQKIQGGWLDFDRVIATPDMMAQVGKLGGILGPRGLMPNPKVGTVTFEVAKAVKDAKGGKVDFKVDKAGNVHSIVGKKSFGSLKIKENAELLIECVIKAKPSTSKGVYLKSITLSTSMGPGVKIDPQTYTV